MELELELVGWVWEVLVLVLRGWEEWEEWVEGWGWEWEGRLYVLVV